MRKLAIATVPALAIAAIALACGNNDTPGAGASDGGLDDVTIVTGDTSIPPTPLPQGGDGGASVVQHHHHATRDGVYLEPSFTKAAAKTMHLDGAWPVSGPTYAAPLFVDGAIGGKDALIVATEQNVVYALDASSNAVLWKNDTLPKPVPLAKLKQDPGCGNIDPLGITGTPFVDLASRTIYLDAMTTPDDGTTKKHLVFALSLEDGHVLTGWPVDLEAALATAPIPFRSKAQNERGAMLVQDGVLYLPFGGHAGDCGDYHGWLIGIDLATRAVSGWATPAARGASWAVAGPSTDGTSIYITTGNTSGAGADASDWQGGEAIIRFAKGPVFSGATRDFFAPANWPDLDNGDLDLGGSAAVIADVPGATPSALLVALGKDGNVYLVDRGDLGGVGHPVATKHVATNVLNGAATVYTTPSGTFVAFRSSNGTGVNCPSGHAGNVIAVKIGAASPPTIDLAWCSDDNALATPIATISSPAGDDAIVWASSTNGDLVGYDGVTGDLVVRAKANGATAVQYFNTPIVAKGRIYVSGHTEALAFKP